MKTNSKSYICTFAHVREVNFSLIIFIALGGSRFGGAVHCSWNVKLNKMYSHSLILSRGAIETVPLSVVFISCADANFMSHKRLSPLIWSTLPDALAIVSATCNYVSIAPPVAWNDYILQFISIFWCVSVGGVQYSGASFHACDVYFWQYLAHFKLGSCLQTICKAAAHWINSVNVCLQN